MNGHDLYDMGYEWAMRGKSKFSSEYFDCQPFICGYMDYFEDKVNKQTYKNIDIKLIEG